MPTTKKGKTPRAKAKPEPKKTPRPVSTAKQSARKPGTKAILRERLEAGKAVDPAALAVELGVKPESVTTACGDLKNPKYCAPGEPLAIIKGEDGLLRLAN